MIELLTNKSKLDIYFIKHVNSWTILGSIPALSIDKNLVLKYEGKMKQNKTFKWGSLSQN